MGRTYIVEETVGQYLSNINLQGKAFVSGLLIGQCSSQKDYVILATRTPPKEEQNENLTHQQKAKLDNLDEEWATEHANQVIIFVFLYIDVCFALFQLVFAMEKSMNKRRLWNFTEEEISERVTLHICSSTKKYLLFRCLYFKVCDIKIIKEYFVELMISMIQRYPCCVPFKNGLARWAKQIENGVYLINGQVKDEDCDLLEGQLLNSDRRSTATVQICSGSVNLKGAVKCRAYIHSNKPKVKDAVQAMKRDILNTVADRCEMLFEDLLLNEIPEKKVMNSEKEFHILPHRVFVPIPGSTVMLCDYKFGDESAEEMRDHFIEMLDHMIQIEDLEIAEEINTACMSYSMTTEASLDNTDDEQPKQPIKATVILKIQQNIGI
ncbi:hypothetical protein GH733_010800 [Mirounga leonina]|nr:hypothetical protein GH733_010800 [Mirounga leonina]